MKTPLILTAFGTTSPALERYKAIEAYIEDAFPQLQIHWAYSSRVVAHTLKREQGLVVQSLGEILLELQAQGYKEALVQSLHLFPSHEFHKICREASEVDIKTQIGLPLLSSPADYQSCCDILAPFFENNKDSAILIVGHGTDHPSWTVYPALETFLRRRFGNRAYVGLVEKSPDDFDIVASIVEAGFTRVYMVPFFLVAGLHYHRDMMGDGEDSWRMRLMKYGLEVESYHDGFASLAGTEDLILSHIKDLL